MSLENPDQRAPLVESQPDAYMDPVWFEFVATFTALVNQQQRTIKEQQTAIEDLEQRVQALETP
ncbi:MAG TPA: hypothetical protein DEQ58_07325 [Alcanivorax sp.]|jgi:hypothetical protein|uniref:hypothetical protein n=1 Tax=Stenotrophomonas sp. TaxID=69392 RepID=UPI000E830EC3|nr:hypothetical protein [Stenotrophomonas sp.]HAI34665.1 hypothetical protein [Alcanivorax sp.]MTI72589.1 hypothetical protein [Stenotrophomonas sp.]MTI72649.1 hypothetical protein [Stenotrophomonas sp.]HAM74987.1 hypothetical protein [Alcanivorax sp.]HBP70351.1 hypothetical protein [Alcanivorax sp.]|tara:strand:+ start:218 stop:409 length:192 start_codon:yes stop_codon:yes gene_type:complete